MTLLLGALTIGLILSLLAGLSVSLLGWKLPGPLMRSVDMLASATSALALFVIGGTLVLLDRT